MPMWKNVAWAAMPILNAAKDGPLFRQQEKQN